MKFRCKMERLIQTRSGRAFISDILRLCRSSAIHFEIAHDKNFEEFGFAFFNFSRISYSVQAALMEPRLRPCPAFPFIKNSTKEYPPSRREPISEINGIFIVITVAIFFFVILLGFSLYLYARLFWRRPAGRYPGRHDESFGAPRLNFAAEDPLFLQGGGLDPSVIAELPTFVYKSENFKDGSLQCAVCLCELKDDEKARQLPKCNHSFHTECIDMWFHSHSTCPLCRASVHPDSPSNAVESGSARQISGSNSMAEDRVSSHHSIDIEIHANPIPQHAERAQTSAIAEKDIIQICRDTDILVL